MTISELSAIDDLKLEFKKRFHQYGVQSMTRDEIINLIMKFVEERTHNNDH